MGKLLLGQESRLIPWASKVIGFDLASDGVKTIGWGDENTIQAVALFERFTKYECSVHLASDQTGRWLARPMLYACFAYPFVQCGLRRMTALVPGKNAAALRFNEHIGFEREGVLREALGDDDFVVMGMLRRNCRFIPKEFRV